MSPLERMALLVLVLNQARRDYYGTGTSFYTDEEFDKMYKELEELERLYPDKILRTSPTQRVGMEPSGQTLKHYEPMLSLNNAFDESDISAFLARIGPTTTLAAEPKMDGLALNLVYEDGVLISALLRGDGERGEDVLHNALTIPSIPHLITVQGIAEVRGEVYMTRSQLQRLRERGEEYANPRNAAAGSMRLKNSMECANRGLSFAAYGIGRFDHLPDGSVYSEMGLLNYLGTLGFPVVNCIRLEPTKAQVMDHYRNLQSFREKLDFDIDGLVLKAYWLKDRPEYGQSSTAPNWAVAFKFPAQEKRSKLLAVDWQLGRTGVITPVARIAPVEVGGVTISNVTLHNASFIEEMKLSIGCDVFVRRAGDVIPQITQAVNIEDKKLVLPPDNCPSCGGGLVSDGAYLKCPDFWGCPDQVVARIKYAASREVLDIDGLGEEKIKEILHDAGGVDHMALLFVLKRWHGIIPTGIPLYRVFMALGIPGVGESAARKMKEHSITNPRFKELFLALKDLLNPVEPQEVTGDSPFKDQIIVFTGTLESMTRTEAIDKVISLGAVSTSSISKKTTLVVAGPGAGSKLDKAHQLKVKVINESEFLSMLKETES